MRRSGDGGGGRRGGGGGGGAVGGAGVAVVVGVRDAELGGVLVLPGRVVDQLDAVAGGAAGREVGGRRPGVGAAVGNVLDDRVLRDGIGGGTLEENEGHGAGGGGGPGHGVGLADRHDAVEAGRRKGIAHGGIAGGLGVGGRARDEAGKASREQAEV